MPIFKPAFHAETVDLEGSNLIEASAGTGKTYSIALLTIRLIIEKGISLDKILMVTFTNAAVAELEIRVRKFIRMALKISRSKAINDETISKIVEKEIAKSGRELVERRLSEAERMLDQTAIFTIHGFCQRTIATYAFESGQIFGAEAISPDEFNQLMEDEFNLIWRRDITTLKMDLLNVLLAGGLERNDIYTKVKDAIGGKLIYTSRQQLPNSFLDDKSQDDILDNYNNHENILRNHTQLMYDDFENGYDEYLSAVENNRYAKKELPQLFINKDWDKLIDLVSEKKGSQYIQSIFSKILPLFEERENLKKDKNNYIKDIINQIALYIYQNVKTTLKQIKDSRGNITFDDMIGKLHEAICTNHHTILIQSIREKYGAVFIDEFQDTDKYQYEIFSKIFQYPHSQSKINGHTLFYIGDPKQSIYGFRKADINTYFNAATTVDFVHKMNTNFRSNAGLIEAMNTFFKPTDDFDTFHYGTSVPGIEYHPVDSPVSNDKGVLLFNGKPINPLQISNHANKTQLTDAIIAIVSELLGNKKYQINEKGEIRQIKPSDIGILVRKNKDGRTVKQRLAKHQIPAVNIDESKVLKSPESKEIFYILEAVNNISAGNINRALLSTLAGYTIQSLEEESKEKLRERFRHYQESWKDKGVYVMLRQFITDHRLTERMFKDEIEKAERVVANTYQLMELLHKIELRKNFDEEELIQWLKKGMEGDTREGNEFEQRIESDEETVKIVTVHKSKGLEYNIVLVCFMDLVNDESSFKTTNLRMTNGDYYLADKDLLDDDKKALYKMQAEQENRRLLYVALTRAKYHCFVTSNEYFGESCLRKFTNHFIEGKPRNGVELWTPPAFNRSYRYQIAGGKTQPKYSEPVRFNLLQKNWRKTSYSGLNPEHAIISYPYNDAPFQNAYDEFVFRNLKKGAQTGDLLHYIFERIDFADSSYWKTTVERALKRHGYPDDAAHGENIVQMLEHVIEAGIPSSFGTFSLKNVSRDNRLSELEFDFHLDEFRSEQLINIFSVSPTPIGIQKFDELEGIMNGKIDLFFRHDGKFYILDWKSNYLGGKTEDYSNEDLWRVMEENNYHLQYHIYIIALCKYLSLRVPGFSYEKDFGGVIYLFLRGVRKNRPEGIFYYKPDAGIIDSMHNLLTPEKVTS